MYDNLEMEGNSLFQHGKYNDRIYLLDFHFKDLKKLFKKFKSLSEVNNYSKIIAKVPKKYEAEFYDRGYTEEVSIPNFFYGEENMSFLVKFLNKDRKILKNPKRAKNVLKTALNKDSIEHIELSGDFTYRKLNQFDISEMTNVYKKVFQTYPFPIFEKEYLKKTMDENVVYFGVFHHEKLIAISSCEVNFKKSYVEMSDFAILDDYRGNNISLYLLNVMENFMKKLNIKKAYTMARSMSYGMNITFSKMDYEYSGTMVNNANISGEIQSLNIWHKDLIER